MNNNEQEDLRQFIRRLRNSVAHFRIEAEGSEQNIERLKFSDRNGFKATIPVRNLKTFLNQFASMIVTS
jgi:hypothetical protein